MFLQFLIPHVYYVKNVILTSVYNMIYRYKLKTNTFFAVLIIR